MKFYYILHLVMYTNWNIKYGSGNGVQFWLIMPWKQDLNHIQLWPLSWWFPKSCIILRLHNFTWFGRKKIFNVTYFILLPILDGIKSYFSKIFSFCIYWLKALRVLKRNPFCFFANRQSLQSQPQPVRFGLHAIFFQQF